MKNPLYKFFSLVLIAPILNLQADTLVFRSTDFNPQPVFSDVPNFIIQIETVQPLAPGTYFDPELVSVNYSVNGTLVAGTPSGFPSFNLVRNIEGEDFYDQGSSINFQIAADADLSDGLQLNELVDTGTIFVFNGREIDNGRFHPALFELYSDGTGRIQNSNNTPTLNPLLEVNFGDEYITDLSFDLSLTIYSADIEPEPSASSSGSGSIFYLVVGLFGLLIIRKRNW